MTCRLYAYQTGGGQPMAPMVPGEEGGMSGNGILLMDALPPLLLARHVLSRLVAPEDISAFALASKQCWALANTSVTQLVLTDAHLLPAAVAAGDSNPTAAAAAASGAAPQRRLTRSYFPRCTKMTLKPRAVQSCVNLVGRALLHSTKHLPQLRVSCSCPHPSPKEGPHVCHCNRLPAATKQPGSARNEVLWRMRWMCCVVCTIVCLPGSQTPARMLPELPAHYALLALPSLNPHRGNPPPLAGARPGPRNHCVRASSLRPVTDPGQRGRAGEGATRRGLGRREGAHLDEGGSTGYTLCWY